jgi:MFS family permease
MVRVLFFCLQVLMSASPHPNPFRHQPFACLWTARLLTTIATLTQNVAIGWQVYTVARLTRGVAESTFLVGMVGLAQFLPLFALALLAGESADRYDRRKIMLTCNGLQILCALALTLLSLGDAPPALTSLFIVAACFGGARAFTMPAGSAMTPMLVPRSVLPRAIGMNALSIQGGTIVGPWIGGVLCAISPALAYGAAGGFFVLAGLALASIRADTKPSYAGGSRLTLIREGLAYLWSNKIVLGAISLDLFAVLLGGATALLPVFAHDILKIGAEGFGLLRSAPALGGGIMALSLGVRPIRRHAGPWMLGSVIIFGLATLLFAFSETLWLSMTALAILGAADAVSVFVRQSLVQIVTPDPMRGRVSAVSGLFISASNELGEFESGVAGRFLGPIGAVVFGGIGSILVTVLWAKLFPALRKADRLDGAV